MNKTLAYGMTAVIVLLVAALFAAVPPGFVPEWTFQGSSLKGWHVLGDADWRAEDGVLIGTPKSTNGGWLVLDQSYQDVAFFASFRSTGSVRTGVLLRAQKTDSGMKGIYTSLTRDDLASYRVTLDSQGQELNRERMRSVPSMIRYAPDPQPVQAAPAAPAAPAGGARGRGPAPVFVPEEWNTIQLVLDVNILRPALGLVNTPPFAASLIGAGATEEMDGYGPVALYVGGSGEVRFKDVGLKDLMHKSEPAEQVSSHFRMQRISDFYYAWCAAVADFNRDGNMDVAATPFYYLGPSFLQRREFTAGHPFNPATDYTDFMIVFAHDFTGDGWPDIVSTYTNGSPMFLWVNPKGESRRWDKHQVIPVVRTEIAIMHDVDADGMPDIIYGTRNGYEFASPNPGNPTGQWKLTDVSGPVTVNGHGVGAGDINGDGRMDIVAPAGWWEQPPKGTAPGPWPFHDSNFGRGGNEMCIYDVNGDGLNDIVTAMAAHQYGLYWYEQKKDSGGKISFVEHMIMGDLSTKNAGNVTFSEPHATVCADVDGDKIPDLVVGKRYFSHHESYTDPDAYGPSVVYLYRTVRNPKAPGGAEFVPELIHNRSGVGSHFAIADVNKDGMPDILTSGVRGTFVYTNRFRATAAAPAK